MSDALRELLASFVIEVDKAGDLAKGNAQIDALKKRLEDLQAAAKPAAKAVSDVFSKAAQAAQRNLQAIAASQLGGGGSGDGFGAAGAAARAAADAARTRLQGALGLGGRADNDGFSSLAGLNATAGGQLGPTRDTFNQGKQAAYEAEQAAAKYAGTLKGKLASAVQTVRDGFNGGGTGGQGPGLIASLATVRNGFLALGAGAAVSGVARLIDRIGDIKEAAQRLGVTTDQFQRLDVLAKQNGTSVEALGTAFRTLANAAVQPTKATTAAFTKLNLSAKDSKGQFKSTNDLFFEVAGALAGVTNEAERSALAQDLLGRGAQQLKPLFASGTAEIEKQSKALAEMNVLSEDTINQSDDLSDSWKELGPSVLAASEPLLKILIPALKTLTDWLFKGIAVVGKWLKQTDLTSIGMTALAVAMATKVIPSLELMIGLGGGAAKSLLGIAGAGAKAALSFLRMALPILVLQDFFAFLRGDDSETGRLIEAIFGKGGVEVTLKAIGDLKTALKDLWKWVTGAGSGDSIKRLWQELGNGITVMINDLLHLVGIGKGGTSGPFKLSENITQAGSGSGGSGAQTMQVPWAVNGAPVLPKGKAITVGDTHVTVTMGPSATAPDVGRAVASAVESDRNALIAGYGGFD